MRYDAYGDESAGDTHVVYGFVCVAEPQIAPFVADLAAITAEHKLGDIPLHCRVLFSSQGRDACGLSERQFDDILALYAEVAKALRNHAARSVVTIARLRDFPVEQLGDGPFPRVQFGKKQLGAFCGHAACLPLMKEFGAEDLKLWVDKDETRIEWLGDKRQASRAIGGYFDLGGEPVRATPGHPQDLEDDGRRSLFQAADFLAWAAHRAQSRARSAVSRRIGRLYDLIAPREMRLETGLDGGVRLRT